MEQAHSSFLRGLAELFYRVKGSELYRYRFFFPNKRSGHFFVHYLQNVAKKQPLILPQTTTLHTYLRQASHIHDDEVNSELLIIYHLYRCYTMHFSNSDLTFDSFYDVGGQLLADFNDIDNQLADAEQIFKNMELLAQLTVLPSEYLEKSQIDALQRVVKGDLLKQLNKNSGYFWEKALQIYSDFKNTLRGEGLAYNGMLMRDIVEGLEAGRLELFRGDGDRVNVFVGLHGLSKSEVKVLRYFKQESETLFYWDYDSYLLRQSFTQRAREVSNLDYFHEPTGALAYPRNKASKHRPKLEIVSIPSKLGQANYITQEILPKIKDGINVSDPNTVIILPDDSQLTNLLSQLSTTELSKAPFKINVTMGFSIRYIPIIGKLSHAISLQRRAYSRNRQRGKGDEAIWHHDEVVDLLGLNMFGEEQHKEPPGKPEKRKLYYTERDLLSLFGKEDMALRKLFYLDRAGQVNLIQNTLDLITLVTNKESEDKAGQMALNVLRQLLQEISDSLEAFLQTHKEATHELTLFTLHDLIYTTIYRARVPFMGEPLEGVQVMGMLEARCIDFENIIVMDAGEGLLPTKSRKYGLIPQNIRAHHELPTYKWQDNIRAYNFFRMISRASLLYATYDSRRSDRASGEPSRYLTLLTHIYGVNATYSYGYFPLNPTSQRVIELERDKIEQYREALKSDGPNKKALSPSAIRNYLSCPRKFYFQNILGLREPDELTEVLEKSDMGTIIHKAMELLYKGEQQLTEQILDKKLTLVPDKVREAYNNTFEIDNSANGYFELYKGLLEDEVRNCLEMDRESIKNNKSITYKAGEYKIAVKQTVEEGLDINLMGYIDRIDEVNGMLRLVDYKTGKDSFMVSLEESFDPDPQSNNELNGAAIQLLTYCMMILKDRNMGKGHSASTVVPILFKPREMEQGTFQLKGTKREISSFSVVEEIIKQEEEKSFSDHLNGILLKIAKDDNEFLPNNNRKRSNCNYCPAREICDKALLLNI